MNRRLLSSGIVRRWSLAIACAFVTGTLTVNARGTVLFSESFTYPDAELQAASGNAWTLHSGAGGQTIVGNALFIDNSGSGDYNRPFTALSSGVVYAGFDMSVPANKLPTSTSTTTPYFAHFAQDPFAASSAGSAFSSRVVMHKGSTNGTYTLGLIRNSFTTGTIVPTEWGSDFLPDVTHRVVMAYDLDAKIATLWIDPTSPSSANIANTTGDNLPSTLGYFCFRIDGNGTAAGAKTIDNLIVATTFSEALNAAHAGDFNGDGKIDGADFVIWQTNFPKDSGGTLATGDANGDGKVDGADFVIWQTNFPYPAAGATQVPEPMAFVLAALMAPAVALRRWRRSV